MGFIKKNGKVDYTIPSTYGRIAPASYVGGTKEEFLLKRVTDCLGVPGQMDETQNCFTNLTPTGSYIERLAAVKQSLVRSRRKPLAIVLCFGQAFDSV